MSPELTMHDVNIGLGGNVGDPKCAIAEALQGLDTHSDCTVLHASKLYRTPPWGKTDQNWFFNACAAIKTALSPDDLLDLCLEIERARKRERTERWGPRTLDLDILTYDQDAIQNERLTIPHAHMHERGFVLKPLADYDPNLLVKGKTVRQWLLQADTTGIEVAEGDKNWWRK